MLTARFRPYFWVALFAWLALLVPVLAACGSPAAPKTGQATASAVASSTGLPSAGTDNIIEAISSVSRPTVLKGRLSDQGQQY